MPYYRYMIEEVSGVVIFRRKLIKQKDKCLITLPKFVEKKLGRECTVTVDTKNKVITIKFD